MTLHLSELVHIVYFPCYANCRPVGLLMSPLPLHHSSFLGSFTASLCTLDAQRHTNHHIYERDGG